ncbi:dUTP diphosphatase [Planococcus rifietoensis]|uniref:dUTP diphosphatase n=1 Tax=Planococcus rifietoensis TaxID=200991 RepID=UPI00384C1B81
MNLTDLFIQQRKLDEEIERKHPVHQGEDRLAKKLLALSVELGECANEWRGFKFWSENQEPRKIVSSCPAKEADYFFCGIGHEKLAVDEVFENGTYCDEHETFLMPMKNRNTLLEEYIDCIHFALSIGNDYTDRHGEGEGTSVFLNIFDYQEDEGDEYSKESIVCQFNGIYNLIGLLSNKTDGTYQVEYALDACSKMINNIIGLGEMLGFTWEQIEQAYMSKNAVNYQRQESGY